MVSLAIDEQFYKLIYLKIHKLIYLKIHSDLIFLPSICVLPSRKHRTLTYMIYLYKCA